MSATGARLVVQRAAEILVVPTIGLAVALALVPGRTALIVHVYLLVVLALALAVVVAGLAGSAGGGKPSAFEHALRPARARHERLPELVRLEREVGLASATAFDAHYRLRPALREIAGGLLAARRGVDLDGQPERARALLGEEAWDLVRPDREVPRDRYGAGLDPAAVDRIVTSIEAL